MNDKIADLDQYKKNTQNLKDLDAGVINLDDPSMEDLDGVEKLVTNEI